MFACGFVKFNFLSRPSQDHLFVQVVHARHGMMGFRPGADHQESAQDDKSSESAEALIDLALQFVHCGWMEAVLTGRQKGSEEDGRLSAGWPRLRLKPVSARMGHGGWRRSICPYPVILRKDI